MRTTHSAVTAGSVTPKSDEARWQAGSKGNREVNARDCANKSVATAIAKAACLGIEYHLLGVDTWLLRHARGGDIGVVHGVSALVAAVGGFEAANNDVRQLVQRMRGGRP